MSKYGLDSGICSEHHEQNNISKDCKFNNLRNALKGAAAAAIFWYFIK